MALLHGKLRNHDLTLSLAIERGTLRRNRSVLLAAAKSAAAEQHPVLPACDVNPASPVPVIPVLLVRSTPSRPQTMKVPLSPQTAVPVANLRTTLVEYVPPRYALILGETSRTLESLVENHD